ncbi:MAG TPA: hypothetical protein VG498_07395 [Terriglobales bacterium]|nr:hypothetical protein [Terriglobales bacterium]
MLLALYFFWLLPIPFLICIAAIMYRRKQHLIYPIFWLYICFCAIAVPTEFICNRISYKAFYYAYWSVSFVALALKLLILRDIFARTLRKYPELTRLGRISYEVAVVCLCCTAIATALKIMGTHSIPRRIQIGELIVNCVAVCVFIFVVTSSAVLGIKWTSVVSGMATGLGLMGVAAIAAYLILGSGAKLAPHAMLAGWIQTLAFAAAVGIFAFYLLPQRAEVSVPKAVRPELLEWAQSMRGSIPK